MLTKTREDADTMIKWLVKETEDAAEVFEDAEDGLQDFSDDPLAGLAGLLNKKYEKTYAVNRSL